MPGSPVRWRVRVTHPFEGDVAVDTVDLLDDASPGRGVVVGAAATIPPREPWALAAAVRAFKLGAPDAPLCLEPEGGAHLHAVRKLVELNGWRGDAAREEEADPDLAAAARLHAAAGAASFGPWLLEKNDGACTGSCHYSVRTEGNDPRHPHSPRYITFMCGGLGESAAWRRERACYRDDPETEADGRFIVAARAAAGPVASALLDRAARVAALENRAADLERQLAEAKAAAWRAERANVVLLDKAARWLVALGVIESDAAADLAPTPEEVAEKEGRLASREDLVAWLVAGVLREGAYSEGCVAKALGVDRVEARGVAIRGRDVDERLRRERVERIRRELGRGPETPEERRAREARAGAREREHGYAGMRPGQALFNALADLDPAFAEELRGTPADPFHDDARIPASLRLWRRRIDPGDPA